MRLRLAASAFALALTLTFAAGASARNPSSAQIRHSRQVVAFFTHGRGAWMPAHRRSSCRSVPWRATCVRARRLLRVARARTRTARSAHYAGWSCITNGASPRAPHEGNGHNGPYSGPLGMTTPWMGHMPPGGDWVRAPRVAVYAIAESVAAAHQFSYSFMAGQWPRTFPPCAGYF